MLSYEQRAVYDYAAAMLQAEGVYDGAPAEERIDAYNWHHDQYFLRRYGPNPVINGVWLPHPEQFTVEEDMGFGHVGSLLQLKRRRKALVDTVKGFSQHFLQSYYTPLLNYGVFR